jgi:hypothetical protein
VVGPGGGATGDGFDRRAGALAAGREPLLGVRREREIDAPAGAGVLEARERVAAERALRVGAQELGPAGADPTRRGPEPETRNTVATMVAETLIPSISSSPSMRIEPQRAFSRASRRTRLRVAAASGGRPGRRPRRLRSPRNSARCQRREVCGLTAKHDNRSIGSSRLAAASNARSAAVYRGHLPPRLKIATGGAEPRFRGRAHRRGARADKRKRTGAGRASRSARGAVRTAPATIVSTTAQPNRVSLPHTAYGVAFELADPLASFVPP